MGPWSSERPRSGIFGVLPARKLGREPKRGKIGEGEEMEGNTSRQNFENHPFDLTCLSAHTKDFMLSSAVRPERRNLDESERPMQALK